MKCVHCVSKKDHRCDALHWIVSLGTIGFSFMFTFVPPSTGPFAGPGKEGQARSVNGCILWCEATETVCDFSFLNFFFLYLNGLMRRLISTYQDTCFIYEKHEILFRLEFILPECMNRTFAKSRWHARVQYSTKGWNRSFKTFLKCIQRTHWLHWVSLKKVEDTWQPVLSRFNNPL